MPTSLQTANSANTGTLKGKDMNKFFDHFGVEWGRISHILAIPLSLKSRDIISHEECEIIRVAPDKLANIMRNKDPRYLNEFINVVQQHVSGMDDFIKGLRDYKQLLMDGRSKRQETELDMTNDQPSDPLLKAVKSTRGRLWCVKCKQRWIKIPKGVRWIIWIILGGILLWYPLDQAVDALKSKWASNPDTHHSAANESGTTNIDPLVPDPTTRIPDIFQNWAIPPANESVWTNTVPSVPDPSTGVPEFPESRKITTPSTPNNSAGGNIDPLVLDPTTRIPDILQNWAIPLANESVWTLTDPFVPDPTTGDPASTDIRQVTTASSPNRSASASAHQTPNAPDILRNVTIPAPEQTQLPVHYTDRFSFTSTISPKQCDSDRDRKIVLHTPISSTACCAPAHVHLISKASSNWSRLQIGCSDQDVAVLEFSVEIDMGAFFGLLERFQNVVYALIINGLSLNWDGSTDKEGLLRKKLEFERVTNLTIINPKVIQPELYETFSNANFPKLKYLTFEDIQITNDSRIIEPIQSFIDNAKPLEELTFRRVQQPGQDQAFFTEEFCDIFQSHTKIILELPSGYFYNIINYLNFAHDAYKYKSCADRIETNLT